MTSINVDDDHRSAPTPSADSPDALFLKKEVTIALCTKNVDGTEIIADLSAFPNLTTSVVDLLSPLTQMKTAAWIRDSRAQRSAKFPGVSKHPLLRKRVSWLSLRRLVFAGFLLLPILSYALLCINQLAWTPTSEPLGSYSAFMVLTIPFTIVWYVFVIPIVQDGLFPRT